PVRLVLGASAQAGPPSRTGTVGWHGSIVPHEPARGPSPASGSMEGVSTPFPPGDVLHAAADQARAAAAETAGDPALVGEHLGAVHESAGGPEFGEVVTHTFASRLPGYVGWHWAVTLAHVPGEEAVTV